MLVQSWSFRMLQTPYLQFLLNSSVSHDIKRTHSSLQRTAMLFSQNSFPKPGMATEEPPAVLLKYNNRIEGWLERNTIHIASPYNGKVQNYSTTSTCIFPHHFTPCDILRYKEKKCTHNIISKRLAAQLFPSNCTKALQWNVLGHIKRPAVYFCVFEHRSFPGSHLKIEKNFVLHKTI